jgi:hypothetical protein
VGGDWVVEFDIKTDLYSDGKEDWRTTESLRRHTFPVRAVGGDSTPKGALGASFFLNPPWKIRPYEADHLFRVAGNFYSEDGESPFVKTVGDYNVFLEWEVSLLTEAIGLTDLETDIGMLTNFMAGNTVGDDRTPGTKIIRIYDDDLVLQRTLTITEGPDDVWTKVPS